MNFFHHKDLGNHLLHLCPKVVKHPVFTRLDGAASQKSVVIVKEQYLQLWNYYMYNVHYLKCSGYKPNFRRRLYLPHAVKAFMTLRTQSSSLREDSYPKCVRSVVNRPKASTNIAGLNPQSTCHFAWQPSAHVLTKLTPLLPQSHDCSCYGIRPIMAPPPLWFHNHTDLRAHDFAQTCNISLVSQALLAPEAGDFVELFLIHVKCFILNVGVRSLKHEPP